MPGNASDKSPPRRLTRRQLLVRAAGGGVTLGLGGAGAYAYARRLEPYWPALEHHEMPLPRLGPGLVGRRVMQLSDLHLSANCPYSWLEEQIRYCRSREPDLIVLTGDYITAGVRVWMDEMTKLLRPLVAPLGVFAVLGNHDYGVYTPFNRSRGPGIANQMHDALAQAGVTVLRNAAHTVAADGAALQIVGLDDLWGGAFDPAAAFAQADPTLPTIALSHNPDTMPTLAQCACDWVLAGHTHGGQVRVPLWGALRLPIKHRRFDAGLFEVNGRRLYVNRGLGCLHSVRFNCRPEITEFTLQST